MTTIALTYRGDGAYRPGIPPRDLDRDDIARLSAELEVEPAAFIQVCVGSGLYVAIEAPDDVEEPAAAASSDEPTQIPVAVEAPVDPVDAPRTTRPVLADIATAEGVEVDPSMTKAAIVSAIKAKRLADAAAAASSDERSEGGTVAGDDPGAESSGEPAAPPAAGEG